MFTVTNDEQTDIAMVQEPAWANLRECCNLFATISAHAAFSDIFTLNAVGVMTEDLKHLFLFKWQIEHFDLTVTTET